MTNQGRERNEMNNNTPKKHTTYFTPILALLLLFVSAAASYAETASKQYFYGGNALTSPLIEIDSATGQVQYNIYATGENGPDATYISNTGETAYVTKNHRTDSSLYTDKSGNVLDGVLYDEFGEPSLILGNQVVKRIPYRYGGHEYDTSIALYDYGYRYYGEGRFLSTDPAGASISPYAAFADNAVNLRDADGLLPITTKPISPSVLKAIKEPWYKSSIIAKDYKFNLVEPGSKGPIHANFRSITDPSSTNYMQTFKRWNDIMGITELKSNIIGIEDLVHLAYGLDVERTFTPDMFSGTLVVSTHGDGGRIMMPKPYTDLTEERINDIDSVDRNYESPEEFADILASAMSELGVEELVQSIMLNICEAGQGCDAMLNRWQETDSFPNLQELVGSISIVQVLKDRTEIIVQDPLSILNNEKFIRKEYNLKDFSEGRYAPEYYYFRNYYNKPITIEPKNKDDNGRKSGSDSEFESDSEEEIFGG